MQACDTSEGCVRSGRIQSRGSSLIMMAIWHGATMPPDPIYTRQKRMRSPIRPPRGGDPTFHDFDGPRLQCVHVFTSCSFLEHSSFGCRRRPRRPTRVCVIHSWACCCGTRYNTRVMQFHRWRMPACAPLAFCSTCTGQNAPVVYPRGCEPRRTPDLFQP